VKQFDVFLSYKSDDHQWVESLKTALQARGVRVWLDKDQIRPGDRFVRALEGGLETSRSVALVATPESISSGWVEDEYSRALSLSNQGQLKLIPLLLRDARLPGFLSNRQHIDFRDAGQFERQVDRLVFPGITGKEVVWYPVYGRYKSKRWERLTSVAKTLGIELVEGEDIHRSEWFLAPLLTDARKRLVLVFDIFEERPAEGRIWRNKASEYVETIRGYRDRTRGQPNEIVFLLYQQADAWERVRDVPNLETDEVDRLKHYFTLHQDIADDREMRRQLQALWIRIQRDLMVAETGPGVRPNNVSGPTAPSQKGAPRLKPRRSSR